MRPVTRGGEDCLKPLRVERFRHDVSDVQLSRDSFGVLCRAEPGLHHLARLEIIFHQQDSRPTSHPDNSTPGLVRNQAGTARQSLVDPGASHAPIIWTRRHTARVPGCAVFVAPTIRGYNSLTCMGSASARRLESSEVNRAGGVLPFTPMNGPRCRWCYLTDRSSDLTPRPRFIRKKTGNRQRIDPRRDDSRAH